MAVVSKSKIAVRDLDGQRSQLRGRRSSRSALTHLPKHLKLAITIYRRQVDVSGDLDPAIRRFLDRIGENETSESIMDKLVSLDRGRVELKVGTILTREWNGTTHRAIVVDDGFLWDGTKYDSLSAIAFAITGTHWNGPRFFGLRDGRTDQEDAP
jgi:hypothetical protein